MPGFIEQGALSFHYSLTEYHSLIGGVGIGPIQHQRQHLLIGQEPIGQKHDAVRRTVHRPGNFIMINIFPRNRSVFAMDIEEDRVAGR